MGEQAGLKDAKVDEAVERWRERMDARVAGVRAEIKRDISRYESHDPVVTMAALLEIVHSYHLDLLGEDDAADILTRAFKRFAHKKKH
jgi:hypothetical protein